MTDEEILNEWCAVLERKHNLYVAPHRYGELLVVLKNIKEDTEYWNKKEQYK